MRREVLYQYDLPIEILDNIPDTEEVFNVIFGRSKDKILIPVLFSNERIFWAYPERETVYKIFELQYVDIAYIYAKFPVATQASVMIRTKTGKIVIPNIKDTVEDVRAALLTTAEQIKLNTGVSWTVAIQKGILMEECLLKKVTDVEEVTFEELKIKQLTYSSDQSLAASQTTSSPTSSTTSSVTSQTTSSATSSMTSPTTSSTVSSHADLFSQFASEGEEDVFEDVNSDVFAEIGAIRESNSTEVRSTDDAHLTGHTPAMIDRIARMVQSTAPEGTEPKEPESDAMIISSHSTSLASEQWHNEGGGDAEILPRGTPWKQMSRVKAKQEPVYTPEDDDSEVYSSTPKTSKNQTHDDDTKVYPTNTSTSDGKESSNKTSDGDDDSEVYSSTPKASKNQAHDDDTKVYPPTELTELVKDDESVTVIEVLPPVGQKKKPVAPQKVSLTIPEPKQVIEEVMLPPRSTHASSSTSVPKPTSVSALTPVNSKTSVSTLTSTPVPTSAYKPVPEAITLHPKDGIDAETIDKSLEALKFLRDNKIISEAEYKKRSLSLFETEE